MGGGGGGGLGSKQCRLRCTTISLTILTMTSPIFSTMTSPINSLSLSLPRMGCIRTEVDDARGLMDGLCEVDAS